MSEHKAALQALVEAHFIQARTRVEPVYQAHFASPKAVFARHWLHKKDIPSDLLVLPRSLFNSVLKIKNNKQTKPFISGKEHALRQIIEQELLDLSGLEQSLNNYCQPFIDKYSEQLANIDTLNEQQRDKISQLIEHKVQQLHLPTEGMREFILASTIALTGRALGDKALISSAASLGATLAGSIYMSQQGFFSGLWVSLFGAPTWVGYAGIGSGIALALIIAPLSAPLIELGMNKIRARKLLNQAVEQTLADMQKGDRMVALSKLASWLQLLPDIAQVIVRL